MVGLTAAHLDRYPHELSGGQRQRVGIARAIASRPISSFSTSRPRRSMSRCAARSSTCCWSCSSDLHLAYLFISHDLQVVQHVADRVAVMYLGGIVETGPTGRVFDNPQHPYTRALLSAAPVAQWGVKRTRMRLAGEITSAIDPPDACRLVGRCPLRSPRARRSQAIGFDRHDRPCACPFRHECPVVRRTQSVMRLRATPSRCPFKRASMLHDWRV